MHSRGETPMKWGARTSTAVYLLFGLIVVAALGFHLIIALLHHGVPWIEFLLIGLFSPTFLIGMICLARVRLLIGDSTLSYTPALGRTRVFSLAEIESAKLQVGQRNRQRLVLVPKSATDSSKSPVIINLEFFSNNDQETLFAILDERIEGEPLGLSSRPGCVSK